MKLNVSRLASVSCFPLCAELFLDPQKMTARRLIGTRDLYANAMSTCVGGIRGIASQVDPTRSPELDPVRVHVSWIYAMTQASRINRCAAAKVGPFERRPLAHAAGGGAGRRPRATLVM